jgi:alkanesulfonate monooxygenase SsuD/methylene tetrahydromethanopterin reductase-like flavin-dependent oxidoreductase (luciferase family)
MWIGARGPRGARIAGRLGAGLLWISRELLAPYLQGLTEGGHDPSLARMGGLVNLFLADDPEAALAELRAHGRRNRDSYRDGGEAARGAPMPRLEVVSPADAARSTARLIGDLPVTDIFCFERIGALDDRLVERHVELLTGEFPALLSAELSTPGRSQPH